MLEKEYYGLICVQISSVEIQKGVNAVQQCSIENQKGAITIHSL